MAPTVDHQMALVAQEDEERYEVELHDDVLEHVFSHVPLVDLVSASHVSKPWRHAVSSSLRRLNQPRPWLIIHALSTRPPYSSTTRAYDPRSGVWLGLPTRRRVAADMKSPHAGFAYALSPSRLSFSVDPLALDWRHAGPPAVWRRDPIVARVGNHVVVAGGGCDFEDEPLAVEIYDLDARAWRACDSMPSVLRDSSASTWLSVAATSSKLIVTVKESGLTHCFDPESDTWSEPFRLKTGQLVSRYNICTSHNGLVLIGLCESENVESLKMWRVFEADYECISIGEMPMEYVEILKSESFGYCFLSIRAVGKIVYVFNDTWDVEDVVACELGGGGAACRWWSVRNVAAREAKTAERLVFTCAEVGIEELERVMGDENRRFEVSPL